MSYLELGGRRHAIPVGDVAIGSDPSAQIVLAGTGIARRHAVLQALKDGQVAIRLADPACEVLVNGVRLGRQPVPLLHGDKVEIGGQELRFVDERRSGSTQYVQAVDPSAMAVGARPAGKRAPTAATGGRLVSLTDGREFAVVGASLIIGRDAGCDVVVTSKSVSRRHAEVLVSPKGYVLVDSSTNGSFVNGRRVSGQHLLARGDVIQVGEHEFRFYADLAPESPPVPSSPPPVEPEPAPAQAAGGAERRLANTLHGVPGVSRPAAAPARPPKVGAAPAGAAPARASAPPPRSDESGASRRSAPRSSGILANVVVRSGALKGQRFPIRVPIVNIGRAEYNDIVLPDESVSTMHAKMMRREGIWMLADLESTNGTLVDGEPVKGEVPVAPGAFIRFGQVQTIFEPTDDTIDPQKGSSTKFMSALKLPTDPQPGG
jgi:pSer/pThr/pTyr-binding forkhead associated (FHA) protein